ncbi:MAG: helix-turn-helix transcriptional regulator [Eubacterium sp.]|nr:helix-turn-helix transcriptional regulator [Eubacterium sp.]
MAISTCSNKVNLQGRELSEHGTTAFPVGCYYDNLEAEATPWHWHTELEAVVVASGEICLAVGEEKHIIRQGEGFFINENILHAAWASRPGACRLHSLVFHPRLVGGGIDSIYWQHYIYPLLSHPACRFLTLSAASGEEWQILAIDAIEKAWAQCAKEPPGYEFAVRSALSDLIFQLQSNLPAAAPPVLSAKAMRDESRIKLMLQFIQKNYSEEISNAEIAASAGISESECLRCFHTTLGTTPIQYVRQFRLQEAARMLSSTNKKIAEIGIACGFRNISYFTKTFREQRGCTPGEYRRQERVSGSSLY